MAESPRGVSPDGGALETTPLDPEISVSAVSELESRPVVDESSPSRSMRSVMEDDCAWTGGG
jgi:hypothetical protein